MSINRGIYKEVVVHTWNGILISHKKDEIVPFAEMWMDLETAIQSKVSQKVKQVSYIYLPPLLKSLLFMPGYLFTHI